MGEISDLIIEGFLDAHTGEYIDGKSPGYPRTIDGSLPWEQNKRTPNAVFGVTNYLNMKGITNKDDQIKVIRNFFPENVANKSKGELCLAISKDFKNFKKFLKEET